MVYQFSTIIMKTVLVPNFGYPRKGVTHQRLTLIYVSCIQLLRELRRTHRHSILNTFFTKTSFHCLLSFTCVTFLIHWPLSPVMASVSWCRSCFVCSGLAYEIYSRGGCSTYIYCVVCYRMIAVPYVRSVVISLNTVTLLVMIRNARWNMSFLYSL